MDENKINNSTISDFAILLKDNEELGSFWYRFSAFIVFILIYKFES